jgi:hypothetical protein
MAGWSRDDRVDCHAVGALRHPAARRCVSLKFRGRREEGGEKRNIKG